VMETEKEKKSSLPVRCVVWKALEDIDDSIALIDAHFASGGLSSGIGSGTGDGSLGFSEEKRCSICTRGGVLVGPYGDESFYVHEHCLLFSQQVTADVNGFIDPADVRKAVRKGVQTRCMKCREFGATVDCCAMVTSRGGSSGTSLPCHNAYHYECANADPRVALDHMAYQCYCSAHSRPRPSFELKPIAVPPGEYLDLAADGATTAAARAAAGSGGGGVQTTQGGGRTSSAGDGIDDVEEDDRSNYIAMMSPRLMSGGSARSGSLAGLSARRSASRAAAAAKAKAKRMVGEVYAPPKRLLARKTKRSRAVGAGAAAGSAGEAAGGSASRGSKRQRAGDEGDAAAKRLRPPRPGSRAAAAAAAASAAAGEETAAAAAGGFGDETGAIEESELSQLRQASRRAMGLREKTQKPTSALSGLGDLAAGSDAAAAAAAAMAGQSPMSASAAAAAASGGGGGGAAAAGGGAAASKRGLRGRKPASKKQATVYPGGACPAQHLSSSSHYRTLPLPSCLCACVREQALKWAVSCGQSSSRSPSGLRLSLSLRATPTLMQKHERNSTSRLAVAVPEVAVAVVASRKVAAAGALRRRAVEALVALGSRRNSCVVPPALPLPSHASTCTHPSTHSSLRI
jgi:hypothetical protein